MPEGDDDLKPRSALLRLRAGRHGAPVLIIAVFFVGSRAAAYAAGVRFDSSPLGEYWQLIDPDLLRTRLIESIFYLHGQPPLFNLSLGLLLKGFPAHYASVAQGAYLLVGIVGALALYGLLVRIGCGTKVSVAVTVLMTVSPATILYENWLFYEYPVAVLLVLSAFALAGFVRTKSFWPGFAFFLLLAAVIWTRSVFQIVWMLLAVGLALVALRDRKQVVLRASVVPLLLVAALYGKNLALFGLPSTNSWFGMHLARMVFQPVSPAERIRRVERGELSRVSLVGPFNSIGAYRGYVQLSRPTGIPVLDQVTQSGGGPNYNNKSYIRISNLFLRDSLHMIRAEPSAYLRSIARALKVFFLPSSDRDLGHLAGNKSEISSYTRVFNRVVYFQTPYAARIGLAILGVYGFALLYGLRLVRVWFRTGKPSDPKLVTLLYAWLTVVYLTLALGLTSAYGEEHRVRFLVDSLVAVLVTSALVDLWPTLRGRLARLRLGSGVLRV